MSPAVTSDYYPRDHKPPIPDLAPNNPFSSSTSAPCSSSPSASPSSAPSARPGSSPSTSRPPSRSPSSAAARSATEKQLSKPQEALSLFPSGTIVNTTTTTSTTAGPTMLPAPPVRAHQPRVNEALHHSGGPHPPPPPSSTKSSSRSSTDTTQGSSSSGDEEAPPPSYVAATGGANASPLRAGAGRAVRPAGTVAGPGAQSLDGQPWKQPPTTPLHLLAEAEAVVDCPHCGARGMSRVSKHNSKYTCLAGLGLGAMCFCLAVVPCLTHCLADTDHECSRCGRALARKRYRGDTEVLVAPWEMRRGGSGYIPMGQMQGR
ncbi:uncharacterized protein B0I36DRAFT_315858 [Microdochium trichocladiopsis]|uniref:LITAF domain-containing protein n=1 Tax=Microdochium trichocladiopsis TaxID=1682393 RepID=A0A9P9BSU3_9PEZI|nr:uncharacterized protein B0I36DRAFT_315858 [Microdochium trichocladiopsis]KAH7038245.1 hypothetical protein B0I36DRAFT_315858 [Microdochium trichocladiopsis]